MPGGTVVKVQRNLGVFVNIGLPNKDVVVSMDDMPAMAELWPSKGDRLMVALSVDDKGRIWGKLATDLNVSMESAIRQMRQ